MNPLLSVCIPTLNRPKYLMDALQSIIREVNGFKDIEVCVSNNCSMLNYDVVEKFIENHEFIHYERQPNEITLDENMHRTVSIATGEYIYLLGDDDYFLEGGLIQIFALIDELKPDLSIINGINVNDDGEYISRLFLDREITFDNFYDAYKYHNNHCMFGAILVKRTYLQKNLFIAFYGTSHAYMSFWASLAMKNFISKKPIIVYTPAHPIVALRATNKTYSSYFLDALYLHMPMWFYILMRFVDDRQSRRLIMKIANNNFSVIFSLRFLAGLRLAGVDIKSIAYYPPAQLSVLVKLKLTLIAYLHPKAITAAVFILKIFKSILFLILSRRKYD